MEKEKLNLLIVDDDEGLRKFLTMVVRKWGYEIFLAGNGIEALEIIRNERINIVICDWMMPQMDGLEFCKRVRRETFDWYVYIILLTSRKLEEHVIKGLTAGADDFLMKPVRLDELKARMMTGDRMAEYTRKKKK